MKLSTKMSQLSVSPTLALNAKATELRRRGVDVLNFAVGEPDFPTPAPIVEAAIAALRAGKTKYGAAGGGPALREAIAAKLASENALNYEPSAIVCGMGAKELLFHLFLALLNEGDEVLLTAPYWVSYQEQIRAAGGVPIEVPMPSEPGRPLVDPATLEQYASPRTVAFILCLPNNPAGYLLSQAELAGLATYLRQKPWWIISDEVYEYMAFTSPHRSLAAMEPSLSDRFIHVNSLSKSFAMTGWRVGFTAGPAELMSLVRSLQSHSSTCLPPFIEEAAIVAVKGGRSLLAAELDTLAKRRQLALDCLQKIPALGCIPPGGAFYLLVDVREVLARSRRFATGSTLAFCESLLDEAHLAVVPGEVFGARGYIRFSYACHENTIRAGFQRLAQAVSGLS